MIPFDDLLRAAAQAAEAGERQRRAESDQRAIDRAIFINQIKPRLSQLMSNQIATAIGVSEITPWWDSALLFVTHATGADSVYAYPTYLYVGVAIRGMTTVFGMIVSVSDGFEPKEFEVAGYYYTRRMDRIPAETMAEAIVGARKEYEAMPEVVK